jgi:hypothetical protein
MSPHIFRIIGRYYRLSTGLRAFFKDTLTVEQASKLIEDRRNNREKNFLEVIKQGIYENINSPYLKLLKLSGYSFNDIEKLVEAGGIDSTLHELFNNGVYFTYREFRGDTPVIRNDCKFMVCKGDFDFPSRNAFYEVKSGATRSAGTNSKIEFEYLTQVASSFALLFEELGIRNGPVALWLPILPGSAGINFLLRCLKIGITPEKWFSHTDMSTIKMTHKDKFAMQFIRHMGKFFGKPLPKPELVNINDGHIVCDWLTKMLAVYPTVTIVTYPSSAIRICIAAKNNNINLTGSVFILTGEPITDAKSAKIELVGGKVVPWYGVTEVGTIGLGCNTSNHTDEVHLFDDIITAIQYKRRVEHSDLDVDSMLFTSLLPCAPKVLLNVEFGDSGKIENSKCDSAYSKDVLHKHISCIRSFEKMTGEGMTLFGSEIEKLLEERLPALFGGESVDYQLTEEENADGFTRYKLLINPRLNKTDCNIVKDVVLSEIKKLDTAKNLLYDIWSKADVFEVSYEKPIATARGKIYPFYIKH